MNSEELALLKKRGSEDPLSLCDASMLMQSVDQIVNTIRAGRMVVEDAMTPHDQREQVVEVLKGYPDDIRGLTEISVRSEHEVESTIEFWFSSGETEVVLEAVVDQWRDSVLEVRVRGSRGGSESITLLFGNAGDVFESIAWYTYYWM